jgi:hypothetical protein
MTGCEGRPVVQFLAAMQRWNEKAEAVMFPPRRLAPELPASATTPEGAFPAYFISDSIPPAAAIGKTRVTNRSPACD